MVCDAAKIQITRQHKQAMANAQLRQERIDRANLNAMSAARVSKGRGFDVIGSIGHEDGKRGETVYYLLTCFRTGEPLEKLLQDQSCSQDRLATL